MRQTDEAFSIQRFVNDSLPGQQAQKPKFYHGRPKGAWVRPIFKLDELPSMKTPGTGQMYWDERMWVMTYFATDRDNAVDVGEKWVNKLWNDRRLHGRIPLWLFDFPYYAPYLSLRNNVSSTLVAGNYSVQIVAENDLGQLTKPSAVSSIAVTAGKEIVVRIPREPKGWPIGYKFHVYLSGGATVPAAAHRVGSVNYTGNLDPTFVIAADVPNGIAVLPATALMAGISAISEVRYRYMSVQEDELDSQVLEDPEEVGLFNSVVRFTTRTPGLREYPHTQTASSIAVKITV